MTTRQRRAATAQQRLAVTERDRAMIDTVARLGTTTSTVLRQLHAPGTDPQTVRRRLRRLTQARLLDATTHIGAGGALHLYTVGRGSLDPGQDRPWAPSVNQLEHTLAVGDTLLQLTSPNLVGVRITGWEGEAELRGWARPGHPRPDLRVHWQKQVDDGVRVAAGGPGDIRGSLQVEVDRATEAGAAWRRKLTRYLTHSPSAVILAVTTSDQRARHLAETAHGMGVHVLALSSLSLAGGGDPAVYDAAQRRRRALRRALELTVSSPPARNGGI